MIECLRIGRRLHDHDAILDAWVSGEDSVSIAHRVGSSPGYIRTIVKKARERGDERAVLGSGSREGAPGRRRLDHDAILDRWLAGWRTNELADFAETSTETIYDLLMAHRRRGDPRAVRRRRPNGEAPQRK